MIRAGIYGATGYTGLELVKLLQRHPAVTIAFATSQSYAGKRLSDAFAAGPPLPLVAAEDADPSSADVVFLCLPHAAAAATAVTALAAGARVIDLSADFRLKDADSYAHWYGHTHPAPDLLAEAVYGLTEFSRETLRNARLVANPGCYPTSVLLGVAPLVKAGVVRGTIIADSKSGVSGAGRAPRQDTHFVEVADNFSPYKIGQVHRHWPEIVQGLKAFNPDAPDLIFSPHLLPVPRGIVSTIYLPLAIGAAEARTLYEATYANEPFVHVLPAGQLASLAHVVYTNRCVISLTPAGDTLIVVAAEDNLVKGAAGQAIQNMNVMYGLDETAGLL